MYMYIDSSLIFITLFIASCLPSSETLIHTCTHTNINNAPFNGNHSERAKGEICSNEHRYKYVRIFMYIHILQGLKDIYEGKMVRGKTSVMVIFTICLLVVLVAATAAAPLGNIAQRFGISISRSESE